MVSAITAITSIFLITSLSGGIVTMYSDMLKTDGDIIITQKGVADTFFSDVNRTFIPAIEKVKGVKSVDGVIVGAGAIGSIPIAGIYGVTDGRLHIYNLTEGTYPKGKGEVIIGEKINVILKYPKELTLFNMPFKVTGVFKSEIGFENGGVVIPIETASEMFHKSSSFLLVSLDDLEHSEEVVSAIAPLSADIDVKSTSDFIQNYNQFKIIKISGAVIASISFFMGFLAIVSIMSIVINDRRYEFGIKRAMGLSKSRIIVTVVLEVMVLTLVSFGIAYGLSYFLLEFLQSVDKFQGYLSGSIDMELGIIVLVGSLIMSMIGALIPAYMAAKTDPIILIHQGQ
jgi:ABC-type antimicrobial peptide transport system permease subunit